MAPTHHQAIASAKTTLILGGARSGKSAYAEKLAMESSRRKLYIATAEALDSEMRERIVLHQKRRGDEWTTLEIPLAIADAIAAPAHQDAVILVDCLTLWLSNLMHYGWNITETTERLAHSLKQTEAQIILVSNEVGQGIVPDNALARQFRDEAGLLHQKIAAIAESVVWMVAGIPTFIKGSHNG